MFDPLYAGLAQPTLVLFDLVNAGMIRDWLEPVHYLIRLAHILSMAMFFGGILLIDLRLVGLRGDFSLRGVSSYVLPYVLAALAVTLSTGVLLFLYDPVGVSSRPYFYPKMILIGIAMANALIFQFTGHTKAVASRTVPLFARSAGALSLGLWVGVIMCAAFNKVGPTRGAPLITATTAGFSTPDHSKPPARTARPGGLVPVTVRAKGDTR